MANTGSFSAQMRKMSASALKLSKDVSTSSTRITAIVTKETLSLGKTLSSSRTRLGKTFFLYKKGKILPLST